MSENSARSGTALMNTNAMPRAAPVPIGPVHQTLLPGAMNFARLPGGAPAMTAAPRPLHYAAKRQAVQAAWFSRAMEAGVGTASLFASGRGFESSLELLRMQHAVLRQLHQIGQDWLQGLAAWGQECSQLKAANTMSKISEQEFNLIGQLNQLVTDQTTAVINLMEGVQVGYGYWVSQKLQS